MIQNHLLGYFLRIELVISRRWTLLIVERKRKKMVLIVTVFFVNQKLSHRDNLVSNQSLLAIEGLSLINKEIIMPCVRDDNPREEIDSLIEKRNENDRVNRLKGYFEKVYDVIESQEINIQGNKTYDLAVKNLFRGKADELSSDDWTNALCTATKSLPLDSIFKFRDSNRKTHVDVWDWFVTHCKWDELRLTQDLVEKKSVNLANIAIDSMIRLPILPEEIITKVSREGLVKTIAEALESLINKDEVVRLSAEDIKKYFK